MSTFDEERETILESLSSLGGFDGAEKVAADDDEAGSTDDLISSLDELAKKAEKGQLPNDDGTNVPSGGKIPSGTETATDGERQGVPSGEEAKDEDVEKGVPSGESAKDETRNKPDVDGSPAEHGSPDGDGADMIDENEPQKQAESESANDSDGDDASEGDAGDGGQTDDDVAYSKDQEGPGEAGTLPDTLPEKGNTSTNVKKHDEQGDTPFGKASAAAEAIETDIIEGALASVLKEGLSQASLQQFTDKVAAFRDGEPYDVPSLTPDDTSSDTDKEASTDASASNTNRFLAICE